MKFSVVVPIYKVEKYLRECVDSILRQTFTDYELILVDDGSPDGCPRMCDGYAAKDPRVKVIHQKNAGSSCARNAGIKAAKGEYLICIDSDDYFVDDRVAEKTDGTDVILYGHKKLYESNGAFDADKIPTIEGVVSLGEMLQIVLSTDTYTGAAWSKVVKLSLLHDNEIEFRAGMISEDVDWYLHLMCHAKTFSSINEVAVVYRQRSCSLSHTAKLNSLTDNLWILEYWPQKFKEILDDKASFKGLLSVMAYYYTNDLILYSGYPRKTSRPYKSRMKAQEWLLDHAVTPRALTVRRFYNMFGFDLTVMVLRVLGKLKRRQ